MVDVCCGTARYTIRDAALCVSPKVPPGQARCVGAALDDAVEQIHTLASIGRQQCERAPRGLSIHCPLPWEALDLCSEVPALPP